MSAACDAAALISGGHTHHDHASVQSHDERKTRVAIAITLVEMHVTCKNSSFASSKCLQRAIKDPRVTSSMYIVLTSYAIALQLHV
jgi:hypothetical protein